MNPTGEEKRLNEIDNSLGCLLIPLVAIAAALFFVAVNLARIATVMEKNVPVQNSQP